jgi:hypothetical protein
MAANKEKEERFNARRRQRDEHRQACADEATQEGGCATHEGADRRRQRRKAKAKTKVKVKAKAKKAKACCVFFAPVALPPLRSAFVPTFGRPADLSLPSFPTILALFDCFPFFLTMATTSAVAIHAQNTTSVERSCAEKLKKLKKFPFATCLWCGTQNVPR